MTPERARAAQELLAFYAEAGVDALLAEEPVDRLSATQVDSAPSSAPEPRAATFAEARLAPPPRAAPDNAPAAPEIAVMAAREAARNAASLVALREILSKFEGCALRMTA